jgi:hypothetical protein
MLRRCAGRRRARQGGGQARPAALRSREAAHVRGCPIAARSGRAVQGGQASDFVKRKRLHTSSLRNHAPELKSLRIAISGGAGFSLNGALQEIEARSTASKARSRLPLSRPHSGACQRAWPWSEVNLLPSLTPSFLTPLTRRIPAAQSALSNPQSAASNARRRTASRQRLMVPGARRRDSKCIRCRVTTVC